MLEIVLSSYILQQITCNNMEGSHSFRVWDGEISSFALMIFALFPLYVCAPPGPQSPEKSLVGKSEENAIATCTRSVNEMCGLTLAPNLLHALWNVGRTVGYDLSSTDHSLWGMQVMGNTQLISHSSSLTYFSTCI